MALNQLNQVVGVLAKEEADYGVAETLSNSADGINIYIGDGDPPAPEPFDYVFDGNIGRASGTLAPQKRTTPNGRFRQGSLQVLPKGLGAAYTTSSVTPPREVHRMLKASGFDATFDTDHWTYTPTAHGTGFESLTLRQFSQGSQYDQAGVICDMSFETQGLGVPVMTFAWRGVASLPSDQSLPSITVLAPLIIAPVAAGITLEIGSYTDAVVRRVAYRSNRNVETARINQLLAGGHAGFVPGGMAPELEIEIERPLRSTFDPEATMAAATSLALDLLFDDGGTANNWGLSMPQAQLASVTPGGEGALATVTLVFRAHPSTPTANDFLTLTWGA